MDIRYYDAASGRLRVKRHYKYVFWSIVIGLAALAVVGALHGR